LRTIEAIERPNWTTWIEGRQEAVDRIEAHIDRLQTNPPAGWLGKHQEKIIKSEKALLAKYREEIEDREANTRAKAIGPCPDLGELFGIYDTHDEAFDVLYAWFDAVWELPKPQREAMLGQAEDAQRGVNPPTEAVNLSCGDPGHDYTEHFMDLGGGRYTMEGW